MELIEACSLAKAYYLQEWECSELSEIKDLGEKWLFYPDNEKDAFGRFHITVSKSDGKIEPFFLPSKENFELLKNAITHQNVGLL